MKKSIFITLAALSVAFPVSVRASETRCGWLSNPTRAHWRLIDSEVSWIIAQQGGYQAPGMDNLPRFDDKEKVFTNVRYGYGCACLEVETDQSTRKITMIYGGEILPLSTCREDPNLPNYR